MPSDVEQPVEERPVVTQGYAQAGDKYKQALSDVDAWLAKHAAR